MPRAAHHARNVPMIWGFSWKRELRIQVRLVAEEMELLISAL